MIDKNNYHQFQPLLYQVATSLLAPGDEAFSFRKLFRKSPNVDVKLADVVALLSDATSIKTHVVIWSGGLMAAPLAGKVGLPQGRGGRINVRTDLTVEGFLGVYVLDDFANIPSPDGKKYPQLASVALQTGTWAAQHILYEIKNVAHLPFHYHDKGFMAMIGRGATIAEIGEHRHELHGPVAYAPWLGVHLYLMSGVRNRIETFVDWAWDYFSAGRGPQALDRTDAARIDWGEDADDEPETG